MWVLVGALLLAFVLVILFVMAASKNSNILVSEKLDGSDYASWKCEMKLILQMKGLWQLTTEEKPTNQSKHEKWDKMHMSEWDTIL